MLCNRRIIDIPPAQLVRKSRVIQIPAIVGKHDLHGTDRIHQGPICPKGLYADMYDDLYDDLICLMCVFFCTRRGRLTRYTYW